MLHKAEKSPRYGDFHKFLNFKKKKKKKKKLFFFIQKTDYSPILSEDEVWIYYILVNNIRLLCEPQNHSILCLRMQLLFIVLSVYQLLHSIQWVSMHLSAGCWYPSSSIQGQHQAAVWCCRNCWKDTDLLWNRSISTLSQSNVVGNIFIQNNNSKNTVILSTHSPKKWII